CRRASLTAPLLLSPLAAEPVKEGDDCEGGIDRTGQDDAPGIIQFEGAIGPGDDLHQIMTVELKSAVGVGSPSLADQVDRPRANGRQTEIEPDPGSQRARFGEKRGQPLAQPQWWNSRPCLSLVLLIASHIFPVGSASANGRHRTVLSSHCQRVLPYGIAATR